MAIALPKQSRPMRERRAREIVRAAVIVALLAGAALLGILVGTGR